MTRKWLVLVVLGATGILFVTSKLWDPSPDAMNQSWTASTSTPVPDTGAGRSTSPDPLTESSAPGDDNNPGLPTQATARPSPGPGDRTSEAARKAPEGPDRTPEGLVRTEKAQARTPEVPAVTPKETLEIEQDQNDVPCDEHDDCDSNERCTLGRCVSNA